MNLEKNQPARRGRPLDPAKKADIIVAAGCLFMEQGFHDTSMDQIARAAGVSKLTLYHRFADKDALFAAVIRDKCQQYLPDDLFAAFDTLPPQEALLSFGRAFLGLLTSAESLAMHRMLMAEAAQNPHMTKLFYQSGPMRVKAALLEKMVCWQDQGILVNISPMAARDFFAALFAGSDLYLRAMLNPAQAINPAEIDAYVKQAVDFFVLRTLKL